MFIMLAYRSADWLGQLCFRLRLGLGQFFEYLILESAYNRASPTTLHIERHCSHHVPRHSISQSKSKLNINEVGMYTLSRLVIYTVNSHGKHIEIIR